VRANIIIMSNLRRAPTGGALAGAGSNNKTGKNNSILKTLQATEMIGSSKPVLPAGMQDNIIQ